MNIINLFAPRKITKHEASKRGYKHQPKAHRNGREVLAMTNHERVVWGRATRMGITVEEYKRRFPKGGPIERTMDEKQLSDYEKQLADQQKKNTMLYVDGSKTAFRCSCGANVFTKLGNKRYQCNGCREIYIGE